MQQKILEEKPYNQCVDCVHIGRNCDGPNFLAMTTERWCEWCHLRKEYLDWTNAHVAEISGVSKISVDRVMSGNVKDLRITTMQAITKALVNGSWGQYPCVMVAFSDGDSDLLEKAARCEQLQKALDEISSADQRKIDFLLKQMSFEEEQMREKDRLLKDHYDFLKRKDRIILGLIIALSITLIMIIGALIADSIIPEVGFFWMDAVSSIAPQ